jgi:hypothetical protein
MTHQTAAATTFAELAIGATFHKLHRGIATKAIYRKASPYVAIISRGKQPRQRISPVCLVLPLTQVWRETAEATPTMTTHTYTTAADLAAAVRDLRPDAVALGIAITAEWAREQMHALGVTRYEDVDESALDAIADAVGVTR